MTAYCPVCFQPLSSNGTCRHCQYTYAPVLELLLAFNTILHERYLIGKCLGQGGFGITYLAFDMKRQAICAIKEYFPNRVVTRDHRRSNAVVLFSSQASRKYMQYLEKYYREAVVLSQLPSDLPVVHMYDYFYENNTAYIVMEYIEGMSMKKMIETRNVSWQEWVMMFADVAESLSYLHHLNPPLIHRDISPDNILVDVSGRPVLVDFGSARSYGEDQEYTVIIKPIYSPPEQYSRNSKQGPWTDLYALCGCMYKAVTKKNPLDADQRLRGEPLLDLRAFGIPEGWVRIIEKGMQLEEKDRYQEASELLEDLEALLPSEEQDDSCTISIRISGQSFEYEIPAHGSVRVGRSGCEITIAIPEVSRHHCDLFWDDKRHRLIVIDHSLNGIFDKNHIRQKKIELGEGDVVYLANFQISIGLQRRR